MGSVYDIDVVLFANDERLSAEKDVDIEESYHALAELLINLLSRMYPEAGVTVSIRSSEILVNGRGDDPECGRILRIIESTISDRNSWLVRKGENNDRC